jgi:hypothetical protein
LRQRETRFFALGPRQLPVDNRVKSRVVFGLYFGFGFDFYSGWMFSLFPA